MRRLLLSTGLAIGIATLTLAAMAPERATFVLTNGERVSGTIVFHTDARNNFRADTRQFSLGTLDGEGSGDPDRSDCRDRLHLGAQAAGGTRRR